MLNSVEHEKSIITSGPGVELLHTIKFSVFLLPSIAVFMLKAVQLLSKYTRITGVVLNIYFRIRSNTFTKRIFLLCAETRKSCNQYMQP